ncbi:MAG: 16S rRNA (cytosine(1402)-N(4))-methyltransferase RsmH [Patescibacteria group bacterium]
MPHTPVLLNEVLKYLRLLPGEFIIDGTVNGGGHSAKIFERILPSGKLLGIDLDDSRLEKARAKISAKVSADGRSASGGKNEKLKAESNLILAKGNYADLPNILRGMDLSKADGLLIDLGFSSDQLEGSGKGFTFMKDEDLCMTYDENETPVKKILNELSERDLAKIIFAYSGEKFAMRIAKAIKAREKKKAIETTCELSEIIKRTVPSSYERGRIHPATRTFQALRIYANHELENLRIVLGKLHDILKPGGRLAIISFHSLEDKMIKHEFRELAKKGTLEILTKKPIQASEEEISQNPRSRSAKLRAAKLL